MPNLGVGVLVLVGLPLILQNQGMRQAQRVCLWLALRIKTKAPTYRAQEENRRQQSLPRGSGYLYVMRKQQRGFTQPPFYQSRGIIYWNPICFDFTANWRYDTGSVLRPPSTSNYIPLSLEDASVLLDDVGPNHLCYPGTGCYRVLNTGLCRIYTRHRLLRSISILHLRHGLSSGIWHLFGAQCKLGLSLGQTHRVFGKRHCNQYNMSVKRCGK